MSIHQPRPYQAKLEAEVWAAWQAGSQNILAVLPTGGGKCLGRGTKVLTYDGCPVPVEDIEPGDELMGPDSRPRTVLSICRGREMLYRVTPTKGEPYVVNESHILSLKSTPTRPGEPIRIVNIGVLDYLAQTRTFRHTHKGWRTGVDFPKARKALPVDPYFLGIWLGDGNAHNATITTGDPEIRAYIYEHAASLGMVAADRAVKPGCAEIVTVGVRRAGRGGTPIMNALRSLGVIGHKHVPYAYRTASRDQRLQLLAGLMDTDGSYSGKGFDFISVIERLADDVVFLARSLGFAAYKAPCVKTCVNNGVSGTYYRVSISGDVSLIPCRLPRKQAKPRLQKKDVLVTGITVEPIGIGDYFGFEIDGDHLFLLGDFTVTHNTFVFSRIASAIAAQGHAVAASAHRAELVSQMSTALAREGVRHRVIGPAGLTRACTAIHMTLFKRSYVDPNALVGVCSVDTLVNMDAGNPWFRRVRLWIQDEAHHVLKDNKWGKACQLFPHAWGLGVTATPLRADGKGLGRHADGLFDTMVVGPYMRELIDAGYLCDYVIKQPPSNIDLSSVPITDSGDFSPEKLRAARRRSTITGDVVQHYLKWANGKLGVTFDTDIESATETAAAFKAAGIPAEVVTSKTPDLLREDIKRRFAARHVLQLVNVDLFGEGYDLPAIEVVSMARPTESYGLYVQQFGRALRRMEGKDRALILDHVGNVIRHGGPPDVPREWTLDRRERRSRGKAEGVIPLRTCLNPECLQPYERVYRACPYCGFEPVVADRSAPEKVDGDLVDLDPAVLDQIRAEIARIKGAPSYSGVPRIAWDSYTEKHEARAKAQQELVDAMALWGGWQTLLGRSVSEGQRRFFFTFGVDVATAQTLGRPEAEALTERIRQHLLVANVQPVGSQ